MIDVIYNPYGAWSLIAPVFVTVLLIIIGPDAIYKGLTIILKDRVNEKTQKTITHVSLFVSIFIIAGMPFTSFIRGNKLSESQYETVMTNSTLSIRSKDPKLKSDKLYFRIKQGSSMKDTQQLKASLSDNENLTVYVDWNHSTGNSSYTTTSEITVSKKSINLRENE